MGQTILQRVLRPIGQISEQEWLTALLMFSYSFLAMSAYNIIKPITRSKFIDSLGADNIPYVQLAAGLLIGVLMAGYTWLMSRLPRRWAIQITQGIIVALLAAFWFLFRVGGSWVSVAFYLFGLILGILLISQFWTLANVVYDARQAKRLFGFIGGGAPLGGIAGSLLLTGLVQRVGTVNLLLVSAALMILCLIIVSVIIGREGVEGAGASEEEKGVGPRRAIELLRSSKHLQMIALVISFAAIGAAIIEQQLNLATEAAKGRQATDAITSFLGQVQLAVSIAGFVIQVWLTSRIHRFLGIGFALMILPVSLGTSALIMLWNAALWAPSIARVLDQSLRYTVDKTTREILYMPLPADIKYEAKPFVDVSVDRFAKGLGAVLLLVLIKPWGLHLNWQQLSYASVLMTCLWLFMALRARRGYQAAFRRSLDGREIQPAEMRMAEADLSTVETLIEELASPDEHRVLYAIDLLEALDKRNLVTPLLLYHECAAVRVRALAILSATQPEISSRWLPAVRRMVADASPDVRMAAVSALSKMQTEQAVELVRPLMRDNDTRIAITAALVMAQIGSAEDAALADATLRGFSTDSRDSSTQARMDLAAAIGGLSTPGFRRLLIPLLQDPNYDVAVDAMRSARKVAAGDFLFVPTLISLLRRRRLKGGAREILVGYGQNVLVILEHFLRDPGEDIWVRRHLPATIARIPCQQAMDILLRALLEEDRFLRYKAVAGIERLRRTHPELACAREPVEHLLLEEASAHAGYRPVYRRLFEEDGLPGNCLLARALEEKIRRGTDRVYRLLAVLYPWRDILAARRAIEHGDSRARARALEYLDNLLKGVLRKQIVPLLEEQPPGGRGPGDMPATVSAAAQESLIQLIYDPDETIASSTVYLIWQLELGNLAGHVEQLLATRDVRDWQLFEAASWVLAALRMPDRTRRALWHEPLPAVELAQQFSTLPLFASVSVEELFRLALAARQVRHEPGEVLYRAGSYPGSVEVLLDGTVSLESAESDARTVQAPFAMGFDELLEGKPVADTVRTVDAVVCAVASSEEFRTALADNTDLLQGLFRMTRSGDSGEGDRLVMRGSPRPAMPAVPAKELKPIEKALVLESVPVFSGVRADEMLWLASIAEEVRLAEGGTLFQEGDPPALYALISGGLSFHGNRNQRLECADAADAVGVYETLAGNPMACQARIEREGLALRIDREDLFDLLAQRPELMHQLFSALCRLR